MDQSTQLPSSDLASTQADEKDRSDGPQVNSNKEKEKNPHLQGNDEKFSRVDDRSGRGHPSVDIAEVLRRWTHALQRIHKQSLHLVIKCVKFKPASAFLKTSVALCLCVCVCTSIFFTCYY